MKATPVNDFYNTNVKIREDGRVMHEMHLWQVKPAAEAKYPYDYCKEVVDDPARSGVAPARRRRLPAGEGVTKRHVMAPAPTMTVHRYCSNAAAIRSRVNGMSLIRVPSACATALPIAAAVGPNVHSPMPSVGRSGAWMISVLDLRHLGEAQDRIALPVERRDPVALHAHLLLQRHAGRLHDAALELVARTIRIDHQARIGGAPDAAQPHLLIDLHLHRDRGIGGMVLVPRPAQTQARARCPPARAPTNCSAPRRSRSAAAHADRTASTAGTPPDRRRRAPPVHP